MIIFGMSLFPLFVRSPLAHLSRTVRRLCHFLSLSIYISLTISVFATLFHCPFSLYLPLSLYSRLCLSVCCCLTFGLVLSFVRSILLRMCCFLMVVGCCYRGIPPKNLDIFALKTHTICQQLIFVTTARSENLFGLPNTDCDAIVL